jgi:hypothetical protein
MSKIYKAQCIPAPSSKIRHLMKMAELGSAEAHRRIERLKGHFARGFPYEPAAKRAGATALILTLL